MSSSGLVVAQDLRDPLPRGEPLFEVRIDCSKDRAHPMELGADDPGTQQWFEVGDPVAELVGAVDSTDQSARIVLEIWEGPM